MTSSVVFLFRSGEQDGNFVHAGASTLKL
ncbi:hypothetical protein A2U01_0107782, partial [Trifolium medium]|nr:hypothetical protein [Trifolium medium]